MVVQSPAAAAFINTGPLPPPPPAAATAATTGISFIIHATTRGVMTAPRTLLITEFKIAVATLPPAEAGRQAGRQR